MNLLRRFGCLTLAIASLLGGDGLDRANAVEYRVDVFAVVDKVSASYDPLYDPIETPPPPEVTAAFAARYAVGQSVIAKLKYSDAAIDNVAADYLGRYPLLDVGAIWVDGDHFAIGPGVVSIQTDQPYMPRTDSYLFHTYTTQSILEPVAASAISFDIGFEGDDLYDSDAIGPPPLAWERAFGYLQFDSGLVWQQLEISIERVQIAIVPEPSSIGMAALLIGGVVCGWRGARKPTKKF